jgi:hypothetical protein
MSFPFDFEKKGMVRAWHERGMTSVNQTRPHCVNQMGKTHSKTLAARHGRGMAWTRHAMCESAFTVEKYCGSVYQEARFLPQEHFLRSFKYELNITFTNVIFIEQLGD